MELGEEVDGGYDRSLRALDIMAASSDDPEGRLGEAFVGTSTVTNDFGGMCC